MSILKSTSILIIFLVLGVNTDIFSQENYAKEKYTKELVNSIKDYINIFSPLLSDKYVKITDGEDIKFTDYLIEKIDSSSFPSMHSTRSMILALTIIDLYEKINKTNITNLHYTNNIIILILTITILLSIGLSRIYLKKHYLIDIVAGWILGIIIYTIIF